MKCFAISAAALLVCSASAMAADELKPGLKPGDPAGYFQVLDCSGQAEGTKICYR